MPYSFSVGSIRCHIISDGVQLSDGGGFFGLVPRVLWEPVIRPDERNRIPVSLRSLLIESDAGLILVDTGQGDKLGAKEFNRLGMSPRRERLLGEMKAAGFDPADVDLVLMTHLHGDHAGGATRWSTPGDPSSPIVPTFPNARCAIQRLELAAASFPNERTRGTYFAQNWQVLQERGQVDVVNGDQRLASGVRTETVPGHTESIQAVWIESQGESLLFWGDVCSWAAHLERLAWVPAFDILPMLSIEGKRSLRDRALERDALLVFQHDGQVVTGRLVEGDRNPVVQTEIGEDGWALRGQA